MVDSPGEGLAIRCAADSLLVGFRVSPASVRTAVRGMYGERLKVAVSAPPEDDRANRELVSTVADWLGLPRDNVTIASGHASRDKTLAFKGIEEAELRSRLIALAQGQRVQGSPI
jgi:uncharacterized protein